MLFGSSFIIGLLLLIFSFTRDKKNFLTVSLFILGIAGLIVSTLIYVSDKNEKIELSNRIDNSNPVKLKKQLDYSNIAKMDALGLDFVAEPPIIYETSISRILKPLISIEKDKINYKCDQLTMKAFDQVIELNPMFPFAYYYLGGCKKIISSPDWKLYIDQAREIFTITTQIVGHNLNHDQAFKDIVENYSR